MIKVDKAKVIAQLKKRIARKKTTESNHIQFGSTAPTGYDISEELHFMTRYTADSTRNTAHV